MDICSGKAQEAAENTAVNDDLFKWRTPAIDSPSRFPSHGADSTVIVQRGAEECVAIVLTVQGPRDEFILWIWV